MYSVMQSDRDSSKMDTFHEYAAYESHDQTTFEQIINFARHDYEQVGVFKIKMKLLVQK